MDYNNHNNLSDYYSEIKANNLTTIKDQLEKQQEIELELRERKETYKKERVKSYEELAIANILYLNGIEYEYERLYPKHLANKKYSQYRPDFYLSEYDIYIEHYGISRESKVPWLNAKMEQEYLRSMEWKRELHKNEDNRYIETYSYYNNEGILLEKLKEKLIKHDVVFRERDSSEILKKLVDNNTYMDSELKNLITTFINQYKVNGYQSFDDLRKKPLSQFEVTRSELFLSIVEPIYNLYQNYLSENDLIDFHDMVNKASSIVRNDGFKTRYKYVVVDEYQDISLTRYNLIDAIREKCNAKMFVVGDDWQSIYRFAGSDVSLFNDFERNNKKHTDTKNLTTTYRNSQELLDIVGTFVMRNDSQRQKHLTSSKSIKNPIRLHVYEETKGEAILEAIETIISSDEDVSEILLLGRYHFDAKVEIGSRYQNVVTF